MAKKQETKLLTLRALAKRLNMSYAMLRHHLMKEDLSTLEFEGYRFVGQEKKNWYAYDSTKYSVSLEDAPKVLPKTRRPRKSEARANSKGYTTEPFTE